MGNTANANQLRNNSNKSLETQTSLNTQLQHNILRNNDRQTNYRRMEQSHSNNSRVQQNIINWEIVEKIKQNCIKALPQHYCRLIKSLPKSVLLWTADDTHIWLCEIGLSSLSQKFDQVSIDGSSLILLNQRDLIQQIGVKSSITIGIIMAWVSVGFKQYQRYIQFNYNNDKYHYSLNNIKRIQKMSQIINNIQINTNIQQKQQEKPSKTKKINVENCMNTSNKPLISQIQIQMRKQINRKNIIQKNSIKQNNQKNTGDSKQLYSQVKKQKILQVFDKQSNLSLQIHQFPYNLIFQLDKINREHRNFYHAQPVQTLLKNKRNNIILQNEQQSKRESLYYDNIYYGMRIKKNLQKNMRRSLKQQLKIPLIESYYQDYEQIHYFQDCFPFNYYASPNQKMINNFNKLYIRDVNNTEIIIGKQQKQKNYTQYYFSLVLKISPNNLTSSTSEKIQICKTLSNQQCQNKTNKNKICKRYQFPFQNVEQYQYYLNVKNNIKNKNYQQECRKQQIELQKEYDQQYDSQEQTYDNQFTNNVKNKNNKLLYDYRKTSNKYKLNSNINNLNQVSNSSNLSKIQTNKDLNVYMLIKQWIKIPQNQFNNLDQYQNQINNQMMLGDKNNRQKLYSGEQYYGNKYKFVIGDYQFLPQFYLYCQNDNSTQGNQIVMILTITSIHGQSKLQIQPQRFNQSLHQQNCSYHSLYAITNDYIVFLVCIDPFSKNLKIQWPQQSLLLQEYLNKCKLEKIAIIVYFNYQKQYYLCNLEDIQQFLSKKLIQIRQNYTSMMKQQQYWMIDDSQQQKMKRVKRIGKTKGNKQNGTQEHQYNSASIQVQRHKLKQQQFKNLFKLQKKQNKIKIWSKIPIQSIQSSSCNINKRTNKIQSFNGKQLQKILTNKIRITHNMAIKIGNRQIIFNINVSKEVNDYNNEQNLILNQYAGLDEHIDQIVEQYTQNIQNNNELSHQKRKMDYNKQTVEEYELYASFNKCIICYSRPNNCLYLDCRHNVTCLTCGKLLEQCPICRKEITDYVRLYT